MECYSQRKTLALTIPFLTSAGENKMLWTENISHLKRKEETRNSHLSYSAYCVSVKTVIKAFAGICRETLSAKAFLLLEVRCSLPLET